MIRYMALLVFLMPTIAAADSHNLSADLFVKLLDSYHVHESDREEIRQDISRNLAKMELDKACINKLREGEWIKAAVENNNTFGLAIKKYCNPDTLFFRTPSKHYKIRIVSKHPYSVKAANRVFTSDGDEFSLLIPKESKVTVEVKSEKFCKFDVYEKELSEITLRCI